MSNRIRVPQLLRWCLVAVVLSAFGVMAMPLSQLSDDAVASDAGNGQAGASSGLVDSAVVFPEADDGLDAIHPPRTPLPVENGAARGDRYMAILHHLVDEVCGVRAGHIQSGPDALTVNLPLATNDDSCLDEVALMFDREQPGGPELIFDVTALEAVEDFPVLHVSSIYTGPMPYIHLKSGKTLFVGAIVNGWKLAAIDDQGAAFTYGDRRFVLRANDDRGEL